MLNVAQSMSRRSRTACSMLLAGAFVWMLLVSPRAFAHAELTQSSPAADAVLTTVPTEVVLTFSQGLDAANSRFIVTGPDGTPVNQGDSQIMANDQMSMNVTLLPNLTDGLYTVQWTSLSAEDGDEATGSFTFTVAATTESVPGTTEQGASPQQPDTTATQPDTTQQPASPLPVTAGEPSRTPSLAIAGCLLLLIAGTEFRRRAGIAAENAAYAKDIANR